MPCFPTFLNNTFMNQPYRPQINTILLTTAYERSKLAREDMVMKNEEVAFIKLECGGELLHEVPDTLNELCEDWRRLFHIDAGYQSTTLGELVSKRQPVLLNKSLNIRYKDSI